MDEMMNYVFKGIAESQEGINQLNKKIKVQVRHNKQVVFLVLCGVGLMTILSNEMKEQKKDIRHLRDQVDSFRIEKMQRDIKTPKGE